MKLLVSAPLDFLPDLKARMAEEFDCAFSYGAGRPETEALLSAHPFEAWLVSPCPEYVVDRELTRLCPTLRMIATPSTGSNHVDVAAVENAGIKFYALKGTDVVERIYASSEFTFNLMISTIRKFPLAVQAARDGRWRESEGVLRGRELNGLTLAIIGYGRIGRNLARYSLAFGMKVAAYDPYVEIPAGDVRQSASLPELLAEADVVSVCVHLNPETFRMIDERAFAMMKHGVYFINTSRGDVVDEAALIRNLMSGKVLAAGLDVITDEFTGDKDVHPLIRHARTHDNLIITPHIAGLTYDSERKAQTAAYEAIKKHLQENEVKDAVHR